MTTSPVMKLLMRRIEAKGHSLTLKDNVLTLDNGVAFTYIEGAEVNHFEITYEDTFVTIVAGKGTYLTAAIAVIRECIDSICTNMMESQQLAYYTAASLQAAITEHDLRSRERTRAMMDFL